ncbi:hypothetical protein MST22_04930 [Virgibacillus halodenitrificans]|uniref:hypothetical protein n=1 Tax=Virgibacillus halodenitrificans TaxID=1482 RepID=UPI001FB43D9F|nr:hypothetical protein [Virgibacillus halodenitrificans]MCJ0930492.1 hypothetical protein [Virgibacillus halodenitrificans]
MIYNAKTNKGVQLSLFLLCLLLIGTSVGQDLWTLYYLIPSAIFILLAIFINYSLEISDGVLGFQIRILNILIYNKMVNHKQIIGLDFKRVGWGKKCAVIKIHKGFNFRVIDFNPKTVFKHLVNFATDYDIPVSKTKEYTILDK